MSARYFIGVEGVSERTFHRHGRELVGWDLDYEDYTGPSPDHFQFRTLVVLGVMATKQDDGTYRLVLESEPRRFGTQDQPVLGSQKVVVYNHDDPGRPAFEYRKDVTGLVRNFRRAWDAPVKVVGHWHDDVKASLWLDGRNVLPEGGMECDWWCGVDDDGTPNWYFPSPAEALKEHERYGTALMLVSSARNSGNS
jgi:hypothetical protein